MSDPMLQKLIELLATQSYREGAVALSSGAKSNYYIDGKQVTYRPDGAKLVGRLIWRAIEGDDVTGVGGLTLGADAIVVATVLAAHDTGTELAGFSVRKETKGHGMRRAIEGVLPDPGAKVAIVDDVVTSGSSLVRAIQAAREAGLEVVVAIPIVDREQGARVAVEAENVRFAPLCTASQVRDTYKRLAVGAQE